MSKRILSLVLISVMMCGLLTGCGFQENLQAAKQVEQTTPVTLSEVTGTRMSISTTNEEIESEIYNYITDRIVVDSSLLISVKSQDEKNIRNLIANINTQLSGKAGIDALTDEYANYLLLEFARTPFEWSQSNVNILGFDPSTRLYFVDVTYSTTGQTKMIVPNSKIANGDPDGTVKKTKRYTDYITMLTYKMRGDSEKYTNSYNTFISRWGEIDDIFAEQQGVSLYERTQQRTSIQAGENQATGGIGKLTYSGLQSNGAVQNIGAATMTVRYVLKYELNLGEETDMCVESLYVKDFKLNNADSILKSVTKETSLISLEVLKPFIDELIWSYNKCVEESNPEGLYSLYSGYETIDKYYDEIRDYTYNSIGAYTYEVLSRNGHTVVVKVNRINQIRARGADMSLPTYEETLLFVLELGRNDTILIKNIYLLNRNLIGEPLSVIRNVSGISEQIQYATVAFSDSNSEAIKETLKKFSAVVTNGDYSSDAFLEAVDIGISQVVMNRMANTIKSIVPTKKAMYIVSWDVKTNVYCSLTVREVFQCDNGNCDTEAVIDLGYRDGSWKVVNYTRTVNIKTDLTELTPENTSQALCLDVCNSDGETTKINGTNKSTVKLQEGENANIQKDNTLDPDNMETPAPETTGSEGGTVVEVPTSGEQTSTSGGEIVNTVEGTGDFD